MLGLRRGAMAVSITFVVALLAAPVRGASAPGDIVLPTSTTTTEPSSTTTTAPPHSTTTAPPSTTSTTALPLPGSTTPTSSTTTTTTAAGGGDSSTSTTSTTAPSGPSGSVGETDGPEPTGPQVLPPGAQAIIDSVIRSPANSTEALMAALQPLVTAGVPQDEIVRIGFGQFPVGGLARFSDDWLDPRFAGGFHFHHGCDVFADGGLPVRAPADGVLRQSSDPLGGMAAYVTEPDGTFYYMAHVAGFVEGQASGQQVKAGDVVAYVGNTGDAVGGATHVHFEVHPGGGGPVDPKPYLDMWLADALAAAPTVVATRLGLPLPGAGSPSSASALALGGDNGVFDGPSVPSRSQLLWASSASPAGGALQLASAEATEAANAVDWAAESRRYAAARLEWQQADAAARAQLAPLTPPAVMALLRG